MIRYTQECLDAAQGQWPASGTEPQARRGQPRPKTIRVFENGFLENVLGKAHPITPIVWFGPFIAIGAYQVVHGPYGVLRSLGLLAGGWLFLSLVEYSVHRFLFHRSASTPDERFRSFMMHGYHHEFPNDPMRLVAPPLMSWPIGALLALLYYVTLGPGLWMLAFAGSSLGYVAYDWIHYYTHHFRPKNPLGKWLRDYHLQHHHDEQPGRYGVSSPLWDLLLGTYVPLRRASKPARVEAKSLPPQERR